MSEEENEKADEQFLAGIDEARTNHDKAVELYLSYIPKAETEEERLRRIHNFRSGGW